MLGSKNNRVQSRLLRVFLLQLVLISVVTVIGVLTAGLIVERLLVKKALQGESEFFWDRCAETPNCKLPETMNLSAFLSVDDHSSLPVLYRLLGLGQHRVDVDGQRKIVHVSERHGERLYLLFDGGTVGNLAFYFGVLPLVLVLLTMYGFAFITYLLSKQAVSPLSRLAGVIETFDFNTRDATELNLANLERSANSETEILAEALDHFVVRSQAHIERERNFTRFASHELRTPLAVIQGSVSSLELLHLEGAPARAVERIKRTSKQMSELLNTLLLLAREETEANSENTAVLNVNGLADRLVAEKRAMYSESANTVEVAHRDQLYVKAPEAVLSIVIGNILGNAFSYTQGGRIFVSVESNRILIEDTGVGMDAASVDMAFEPFFRANVECDSEQHQGLGLAIVRQSCRNYGWVIGMDSVVGEGTRVCIEF